MFVSGRVVALVAVWLLSLGLIQVYLMSDRHVVSFWPSLRHSSAVIHADNYWAAPENAAGDAPKRGYGDDLDSVDPLHRPFSPYPRPKHFPRLQPTRFLPDACMESWFTRGELDCDSPGEEDTLDIIWLWVNGSDPRWLKDFAHWRSHHGLNSAERHYREQNELVYSMRSVLTSLKGIVRTCHLLLYDFPFRSEEDTPLLNEGVLEEVAETASGEADDLSNAQSLGDSQLSKVARYLERTWRIVQTPSWLDFSRRDPKAQQGGEDASERLPELRYASHSEIFHAPDVDHTGTPFDASEAAYKERQLQRDALPTYNSMAIENRIAFLPGMAEVAVAFNDDYFLLRPLSVSDFHSPLYGSILRYKGGGGGMPAEPRPDLVGHNGEFGGLFHANWMMSQRYPPRTRQYLEHVPKVITRSMQHEATLMFGDTITDGAARRFRELKEGEGDVQTQWLQIALRVERWREALLWTWVVAKLGGSDGMWSGPEREQVARLFKKPPRASANVVEVLRGERQTLDRVKDSFDRAGWAAPQGTTYRWTSMDGHLPSSTKSMANPKEHDRCTLDLGKCFGVFWTENQDRPAASVFKDLAFGKPECGDCLLMALVTASGPLGLSAFFPSPDAEYTNRATTPPPYVAPPHLPLTATWQQANFALPAVIAAASEPGDTVNLRKFTMRLLSRYLYTYGSTGVQFQQLKTPESAHKILYETLEKSQDSVLCLNDDIEEGYDEVRAMVGEWFEKRWPDKVFWERE